MSPILSQPAPDKLTAQFQFSKLPASAAWQLSAIIRPAHSDGARYVNSFISTSAKALATKIPREETCFITNCPSYTHEKAHWINTVGRNAALRFDVEKLLLDRDVVPLNFRLDDASNMVYIDRALHCAMDSYAFLAVTVTEATLDTLIKLLEEENQKNQDRVEMDCLPFPRSIDQYWSPAPGLVEYEVVVLHPEHFLPAGRSLLVQSRDGLNTAKLYNVGFDRLLREQPGDTGASPPFPPFTFLPDPNCAEQVNPFLVILNADIKFRRYRKMAGMDPLPGSVENLITKTIQVADLIYWQPAGLPTRPHSPSAMDIEATEDSDFDVDAEFGGTSGGGNEDTTKAPEEGIRRSQVGPQGRRRQLTAQERHEYERYLLSGRDRKLNSNDEEFLEGLYGEHPFTIDMPKFLKDTILSSATDTVDAAGKVLD